MNGKYFFLLHLFRAKQGKALQAQALWQMQLHRTERLPKNIMEVFVDLSFTHICVNERKQENLVQNPNNREGRHFARINPQQFKYICKMFRLSEKEHCLAWPCLRCCKIYKNIKQQLLSLALLCCRGKTMDPSKSRALTSTWEHNTDEIDQLKNRVILIL